MNDQVIEAYVSEYQLAELKTLVGLGYGADENDVAEYLIARGLDDLRRAGVLTRVTLQPIL